MAGPWRRPRARRRVHREPTVLKVAVEREGSVERELPDDRKTHGVGQAETLVGEAAQLAQPASMRRASTKITS